MVDVRESRRAGVYDCWSTSAAKQPSNVGHYITRNIKPHINRGTNARTGAVV